MRKNEKIVLLKFKASGDTFYFGSVAAIYELFTAETIKVSLSTLFNLRVGKNKPYENKVISIYFDELRRKKKNDKA